MAKKVRKEVVIGGIVLTAVAVIAGVLLTQSNSKSNGEIEYKFLEEDLENNKSFTLEYKKETINTASYVEVTKGKVEVSPTELNLEIVGEQTVIFTFSSVDEKNSEEVTCTFMVEDTQAPVITLVSDTVDLDTLDGYDSATNVQLVEDPVDGALAKAEEEPEKITDDVYGKTYETGWYTVTLKEDNSVVVKASDNHGNTTEKTFTLNVKEPEETEEPENDTAGLYYFPGLDWNDGSAWVVSNNCGIM